MTFAQALDALWSGFQAQRSGWNGSGLWIRLQRPDEHSKMTKPYAYIEYPNGDKVPWVPTQTDMWAVDWRFM